MCQVARCLSGCSEKHQASCSSMIMQCFCSIGKLVLAQRWILRLVFLPVNSWGTQQTCHHVTHNSVVTVGMFDTCFRIRAGFSLLSNPSLSELRCRKHYNQHSIHTIYHIYILPFSDIIMFAADRAWTTFTEIRCQSSVDSSCGRAKDKCPIWWTSPPVVYNICFLPASRFQVLKVLLVDENPLACHNPFDRQANQLQKDRFAIWLSKKALRDC